MHSPPAAGSSFTLRPRSRPSRWQAQRSSAEAHHMEYCSDTSRSASASPLTFQNLLFSCARRLASSARQSACLPDLRPRARSRCCCPRFYSLDADTPAPTMRWPASTTSAQQRRLDHHRDPDRRCRARSSSGGRRESGSPDEWPARAGRAGAPLARGDGDWKLAQPPAVRHQSSSRPAPPLTESPGPVPASREYFSLMELGPIGAVVLASGSLVQAIAMITAGTCCSARSTPP